MRKLILITAMALSSAVPAYADSLYFQMNCQVAIDKAFDAPVETMMRFARASEIAFGDDWPGLAGVEQVCNEHPDLTYSEASELATRRAKRAH